MANKPSIGRIVWTHNGHIDKPGVVRPGMIVEVHSDTCVGVDISMPGGHTYESHMELSKGLNEDLCWDWPVIEGNQAEATKQSTEGEQDKSGGDKPPHA